MKFAFIAICACSRGGSPPIEPPRLPLLAVTPADGAIGWDSREGVGVQVDVAAGTDADPLMSDIRSSLRVHGPDGAQVSVTRTESPDVNTGAPSSLKAFWLIPVEPFADGWHDLRFESDEDFGPLSETGYRTISSGSFGASFSVGVVPPRLIFVRTCSDPYAPVELVFSEPMMLGADRTIADSVLVNGVEPPATYECLGDVADWGEVFDPSTTAFMGWYLDCGNLVGKYTIALSDLVSDSGEALAAPTSVTIDTAAAAEVNGCRTFKL